MRHAQSAPFPESGNAYSSGAQELRYCTKCGTKCEVRFKFCPGCGTSLAIKGKKKRCPGCKQEVEEGDIHCGSCGKKQ